ncbi:six-hairpin glycosidase [Fusarium pseudocircinatum]|uniref:Six-hairpin glycosidase n=1 Tax=Fusarium pseudocircinatum TaxID=56676 RepID=A0A8H5PLJ2_9HYPO|nr:six-hairpin glycosidase [Fusarium pseudocircinatum]
MTVDLDTSWIWHPYWTEKPESSSAGEFVYFRKSIDLKDIPYQPVKIAITADTRYKLYINKSVVHTGPVKGDDQAWFYDVLDIQPYLVAGRNNIVVHVLRFYSGSQNASSFPRTPFPGLYIRQVSTESDLGQQALNIQTDETWETALDTCRSLPISGNFDFFLHVFERVDQRKSHTLNWVVAKPYRFMVNWGLSVPWNMSPRMIPFPRLEKLYLKAIHNIRSIQPQEVWERLLDPSLEDKAGIVLAKGTVHHVELEAPYHITGYVDFRFARPSTGGSKLDITWSESYEEGSAKLPFQRMKGDRSDTSRSIVGPKDQYIFGGAQSDQSLVQYGIAEASDETFSPFHFRTFRFLAMDIHVTLDSDLVLNGIDIIKTNYPLEVLATFPRVEIEDESPSWFHKLWEVSLRTLENCMHDCYEDCPFYEQLQYAMDTRSSALFTYVISRDDRLARQAILQFYSSFQPKVGLTASRAPCHHLQIISHFSLFWICMVTDHYEQFGDREFVAGFLPIVDAILHTFSSRLDQETGLLCVSQSAGDWEFVDWTDPYKPFGVPPAAKDTGYLTYTNQLFAYTLQRLSALELCLGKPSRADEHKGQAELIVQAIGNHCFDGTYFTDGLASLATRNHYSEHCQIWAVLCGAVTGKDAFDLLNRPLTLQAKAEGQQAHKLAPVSIAMAFYSLRALSIVGNGAYEAQFFSFWEPWRKQLELNLTTWMEDYITQRSDCHAWGSLPLYEYTTEVTGFKLTMIDGERVLIFKPRVSLFKAFEARVPVSGTWQQPVLARVSWQKDENNEAVLTLSWETEGEEMQERKQLPVHIILPNRQEEVMETFSNKYWKLSLGNKE